MYDVSCREAVPLQANLSLKIKTESAQKRSRPIFQVQNVDTSLTQDFKFATVSNRIKASDNGAWMLSTFVVVIGKGMPSGNM